MSFEQFRNDDRTLDAVVRNIAILGEAARHVPEHLTTQYNTIPWAVMRGIRNVVVHQYFGIDETILWETIQHDLPPIVPLLEAMLATAE